MSTKRPNKPKPVERARYVAGWILALTGTAGFTADCPACLRPATTYNRASAGIDSPRWFELAHTTPYDVCGVYRWDVLAPLCNECNGEFGDTDIPRECWPTMIARTDTRVSVQDAESWRARANDGIAAAIAEREAREAREAQDIADARQTFMRAI